MAKSKPTKRREYYLALKRLVEWLKANMVAKGYDAAFVNDRLSKEFGEFEKWYLLGEDPATRTPDVLKNRDDALKLVDVSYSIAIEMVKANQGTTDAERAILGIAIGKGGGKKPWPAPDTHPEFSVKRVKAPAPGRLTLVYKDYGKKLEGRPPHVSHMEYIYVVSDEVITDHKQLINEGIDSASPIVMDHEDELRGKKFSISGRWVSNGGEAGPWGPIQWFIIP